MRDQLTEHIRSLELRLLDPRVRATPTELEALLAEDFIEFGSSGRIFDRPEVIRALQHEPGTNFSLQGFSLRTLAENVVLATYTVTAHLVHSEEVRSSLRSSVWLLRSGRWQLCFHQGTPLRPETRGPAG